jgi:hypothetical protein
MNRISPLQAGESRERVDSARVSALPPSSVDRLTRGVQNFAALRDPGNCRSAERTNPTVTNAVTFLTPSYFCPVT